MSSLDEIGQKLKTAREAQGLTLRQIYERTKIPMGHLMSIDNAQADDLPEPVYVSGYIKRYAECVGLDGQALSEEYRRLAEESLAEGQRGGPAVVYSTPEYMSRHTRIDRGPPTFKTIYFNALIIVIVVGLISYVGKLALTSQVNQVDPAVMALREAASKTGNQATAPAVSPQTENATAAGGEQPADARITLSASQRVWVDVKSVSTGESKFTGFLEQGDRREFQDPQGLRVRARNGGSLTVDNQGKLETFGAAGSAAERTFMARASGEVAGTAGSPESKTAAAGSESKPAAALRKPVAARRSEDQRLSAAREKHYRRVDDLPSRQYIPGESLDGTRSIDVPYRYSEGRLDND